ncbi:rhomboid family intramembrane serine protease [Chitinispirillales bacterium ANBcel5]|uniref:rhomboid family intramembrane serine protease n=1 Tax=Cellulosispirillum alkaliphilum TaxID=3039283 RepID=UPI002A538044|nr:rhomboid family intramembrane serine protease [Chitinispirillales bacterium ANBcel5]
MPYSTDEHDGEIGIISVSIITICVIVFSIIYFNDVEIRRQMRDVNRELIQITYNPDSNPSIVQEMFGLEETKDKRDRFVHQRDSLKSVLTELGEKQLLPRFAFIPEEKSLAQIFLSMFAHASWFHLLGNMLFFYVCGVVMEKYWGHLRFLMVYLLSGVGAVLVYLFQGITFASTSDWASTPLVGASGAIAGTMGAMMVIHPKSKIKILFFFFVLFTTFQISLFIYLGFWIFTQVLYTLMDPDMSSGVAFSAHVGGFLTGVLFAYLLKGDELKFDPQSSFSHAPKPKSRVAMLSSQREQINKSGQQSPVQTNSSLLSEGWLALKEDRKEDASECILRGIELIMHNAEQKKQEVAENIDKLFESKGKLTINGTQVYQWAKKLQLLNMPMSALRCFDIAATTASGLHLKINSRYAAALLRNKMMIEYQKAEEDLRWIIDKAPDSIPARDAQELIEELSA